MAKEPPKTLPVPDLDDITGVNVDVLGEAPPISMGSLHQSLSHSIGMIVENPPDHEQQAAIALRLEQSDVPDNMLAFLEILRAAIEAEQK